MRALHGRVVDACRELTLKTIVSRSPACAGKLRCSRSEARWASELGSVKLFE